MDKKTRQDERRRWSAGTFALHQVPGGYRLSGSFGKVKPFSSIHPLTVQPLQLIIPPVVFADLLKDEPEPC